MRYTGLAIAVIGAMIAIFTGVAALSFTAPSESDSVIHAERRAAPELIFPLIIACVATITGLAMFWFGGRGYEEPGRPDVPPGVIEG